MYQDTVDVLAKKNWFKIQLYRGHKYITTYELHFSANVFNKIYIKSSDVSTCANHLILLILEKEVLVSQY